MRVARVGMLLVLSLGACQGGGLGPVSGVGTTGAAGCRAERPYAASSAWNTPIGPSPTTNPNSTTYLDTLTATGATLTSDVDQYTIAVHCVTASTPRTTVTFTGYYSDYLTGTRTGHGYAPTITDLPIPTGLTPPAGTDAQVVIWDQTNNIEYGFWQFAWQNGHATATNGYAIRTDPTSPGRFADGLAGRGAGLPYLAGLVRPDELAAGHIDHALAFGYHFPSHDHVFPASKSDGKGTTGTDLPEGTRLQLDPTLTPADLTALGVNPQGQIIAKALQQYGMYVVDNSGSAKVYVEDRGTAGWDATVHRKMLGTIPWSAYRVVEYSAGAPAPSESPTPTPTPSESPTTSTPAPVTAVAEMSFEDRRLTGAWGATLVDGPVALETARPLAGTASARFPRGTRAAFLEHRFDAAPEHTVELTLRINQRGTGETRIVQSLDATGSGTVTTGSFWLKADGTLVLRNYNTTIGLPGPKLAVGTVYRLRLHQRSNGDGTTRLEGFVAPVGQPFGTPFSSTLAAPAATRAVAVVRVGVMASNNSLDATADDVRITVA